jgi:methylornithine synthase
MRHWSKMSNQHHYLQDLLFKAENSVSLSRQNITDLLNIDDPQQTLMLFETAGKIRRRYFGKRVFLYGFLYTSTYCRNDCSFCFFRSSNPDSTRYRKAKPDILSAAKRLAKSGVHLIDLTMGEDPLLFNDRGDGFEQLLDLVVSLKQTTGLPVMISPGVMTTTQLKMLARAGASWYACYQETHNRQLFAELRPKQNFDPRMAAKINAHSNGLLIEEGLLCGVGETLDDMVHSLTAMKDLQADQIRAMTFIPQPGTPMAANAPVGAHRETILTAVMRLVFPDIMIPASLDVDGIDGLKRRLNAGANVVTSIVPPGAGLAGVARPSLGIEDSKRTVSAVTKVLAACGLETATQEEYNHWIAGRQRVIGQNNVRRHNPKQDIA